MANELTELQRFALIGIQAQARHIPVQTCSGGQKDKGLIDIDRAYVEHQHLVVTHFLGELISQASPIQSG